MGCEICGRGNCCKSFHSLEEQQTYDDIADDIKKYQSNAILEVIQDLDSYWGSDELVDDEVYVKLSDIEKAIWDCYL